MVPTSLIFPALAPQQQDKFQTMSDQIFGTYKQIRSADTQSRGGA